MVHNKRESVMKAGARMRLAVLLGLFALVAQSASAGSAVAWDGHGHVFSPVGYSVNVAKQRAIEIAHQRYGGSFKLLAYSDVAGYGAIAIARNGRGSGSVIGVTLSGASAPEVENRSLEKCRNAGGINPKIIRTFKD